MPSVGQALCWIQEHLRHDLCPHSLWLGRQALTQQHVVSTVLYLHFCGISSWEIIVFFWWCCFLDFSCFLLLYIDVCIFEVETYSSPCRLALSGKTHPGFWKGWHVLGLGLQPESLGRLA